jgi:hypothetical protein
MLTVAHHTIMTYGEDPTFLYPWHGGDIHDCIMARIREHASAATSAS